MSKPIRPVEFIDRAIKQMVRAIQTLRNAGIWAMEYLQTTGNLTTACETLHARRIQFYPAPDLREQMLNVTAMESTSASAADPCDTMLQQLT